MELEYICSVTPSGEIHIPQSKVLKREVAENFTSKQITLTIKEYKKSRRHTLNRFYWGYIIRPILKSLREAGYATGDIDEESVHVYLKNKFLSTKVMNEHGEFLEMPSTTKKLTNTKMLEYLEDVVRWSVETLGLELTFPWEILKENETYNL
jgi:hypothetical protein